MPSYALDHLQRVMNASARMLCGAGKYSHSQENNCTSPAWFVIGCLWHSASSFNCVWWCTKRCTDWPWIFIRALRKFLCWKSNSVVRSPRPCSSADEDKVRRTCIRRRRSGGMEPVARSQLSVLGQFQDGAEDIFLHCWHLTPHFLSSCCCMHIALYERLCNRLPYYGALEVIVTLLWTHAQRCVHVIFCRCFLSFFYSRLSWPNGWTDLHETFTRGRY